MINRGVRATMFSSPPPDAGVGGIRTVPQFKRYSRRHKGPGSSYVIARAAVRDRRRSFCWMMAAVVAASTAG